MPTRNVPPSGCPSREPLVHPIVLVEHSSKRGALNPSANRLVADPTHHHVACEQARRAVEGHAVRKHAEHRQFQECVRLGRSLDDQLENDPGVWLHLNPTRHWARFPQRAALDGTVERFRNVLFFAVEDGISTAVLELEGQALLNELDEMQPCHLDRWAACSGLATREQLVQFTRDLVALGLVALEARTPTAANRS